MTQRVKGLKEEREKTFWIKAYVLLRATLSMQVLEFLIIWYVLPLANINGVIN